MARREIRESRILAAIIQAALVAFPTMRLGQLIDNALKAADLSVVDLFWVDDDDLKEYILLYMKRSDSVQETIEAGEGD